jgi:RNA polymerase sigma-70 factor (ECF subfamily)
MLNNFCSDIQWRDPQVGKNKIPIFKKVYPDCFLFSSWRIVYLESLLERSMHGRSNHDFSVELVLPDLGSLNCSIFFLFTLTFMKSDMMELCSMYDLEREKSLIQAAQAGDRGAFERLYEAFFPGLYGYVRSRMSTTVDAEDLVSDVVLSIVQSLSDFRWRHPGSFRAWVFQIARRKLADHYRQNPMSPDTLDENETLPDATPTPEMQTLHREIRAGVLRSVKTLSARKQEVVLLHYFGGLQNKEIAAVLDLDERTVSAHLSRALSELQRELDRDTKNLRLNKEPSHD